MSNIIETIFNNILVKLICEKINPLIEPFEEYLRKNTKITKCLFLLAILVFYILNIKLIFNNFFRNSLSSDNLEEETCNYTCTNTVNYSGCTGFQTYTIEYDKPISYIEVTPYPYLEVTTADHSTTLCALDMTGSSENAIADHTFILHLEPNGKNLATQLENSPDNNILSVSYSILFQIETKYQKVYDTHYYLYDDNNNFIEISKREAEKLTCLAGQNHIDNKSYANPNDIINKITQN